MDDNSEVLAKYQRLALEYSKLKAQIPVLKTAVSEEQHNAAELQETLKKKDQLVRKLEQEVECLNFRNTQLTKRVSVLQNDLEDADSTSKHSKSKPPTNHSSPLSESFNVINAELQSRIEENERLHQQIYSADLENQKKIIDLASTVESLQSKLAEQERKFSDKISDQETLISSLQKEKMKMQILIKNHEQEMKNHQSSDEIKDKDLAFVHEDLSQQLEEAKRIIADQVNFDDRCKEKFNALNVPIIQRAKHEQLLTLMMRLQEFVADFSRQLSDLQAFMIQRLCSNPSDSEIKTVVMKLESHLRENILHLKAIPPSFENITSAIKTEVLTWDKSSIAEFFNLFQKCEKSLEKLLPYLILRIQSRDSWSPKLLELIPKLVSLSKKSLACFNKLSRYIQLLAAIGSERNQYHIPQETVMGKILSNIHLLQEVFDESRKLFGSKIASDHQLPTISQADKSTDECILTTLVSLSSTLKKITDALEKNRDVLCYDIWYWPNNFSSSKNLSIHPSVWQYKEKGNKYIKHINQVEPDSIPYEVALKSYQTLTEHADNQESLSQELQQYQNKLMALELEKENWMLECQLLKAKESKNSNAEFDFSEATAQDSSEIHQYVENTVNRLISQIQLADSKAMAFKSECETLYQRLQISLQKKEALESEILSSREIIKQMKEEQKTVSKTYDEQLNTMSEHLANLNETLASQKDEIDALKQAARKGSKKGKSK